MQLVHALLTALLLLLLQLFESEEVRKLLTLLNDC